MSLRKVLQLAEARGLDRRWFLAYSAGLASIPLLGRVARSEVVSAPLTDNPFKLGVASGDPSPRSVVLWTRLAPEPLAEAGGMDAVTVPVEWELAEDEQFAKVVRRGTHLATPQLGHSVHVEPSGLEPDRWYFYRFRAGDAESPVGRTRTMPAANATPDKMRFAFVSCQHFEAGYYCGYRHMLGEDLDMVFHLGDYIYEGPGKNGGVRKHAGREIHSLDDYRRRHAQYRSDPLLHGMHARCPWMVTWDDHEFDNNCANDISEELDVDPVDFLVRRANAYQAYYEAMPLARRSLPQGANLRLYRTAKFGRLAEFAVLDTRQYRSDQPNGDRGHDMNDAATNNKQTMLGPKQKGWLQQQLIASRGQWNVIPQQVMMGTVDRLVGEGRSFSMDQWPGYVAERNELMQFLHDRRVPNPVVLTGDIHSNWVNNLRIDDLQDGSPVVATEFVGTSISSGGNGTDQPRGVDKLLSENACLAWHNAERGYVSCTVTPDHMQADYLSALDVTREDGEIVKRASFVVSSGRPGAEQV
jgi:alkaline phosphatase D